MHDCFVMSGKESRILKELCSLHLMLTWGIPIEISEIRIISENISSCQMALCRLVHSDYRFSKS